MSKAVKAVIWATAIIGTGYGLMRFTVPNDAQMRKVIFTRDPLVPLRTTLLTFIFFSLRLVPLSLLSLSVCWVWVETDTRTAS